MEELCVFTVCSNTQKRPFTLEIPCKESRSSENRWLEMGV